MEIEDNLVEQRSGRGKRRGRIICALVFVFVVLACAIAIPIVISQSKPQYQYDHSANFVVKPNSTLRVQDDVMVDCTGREGTESECRKNGCIWQKTENSRAPRCIYPKEMGYILDEETTKQNRYSIRQVRKQSQFGTDIHQLVSVTVDQYSPKILRIKFMPNVTTKPYEIPEEALPVDTRQQPGERIYNVSIQREPVFGVVVTRISTGTVVFNTSVPGLILSEQFLQITNRLPSANLYGFGEHNHQRFKHDMNWKTWPMFTRDTTPTDSWNLYGSHPVYMNLENDGNANMVFLRNSNGMDIQVQPDPFPAVTYRVIGGVLDFFVFLGPTPTEAVQQYVQTVGLPAMPPYWSLGFHLCRYGFKNLTEVKNVRQRNIEAMIPYDTQWIDIDYMYKKFDFTYDRQNFRGLPEFVEELHSSGQKLVVIVDPGIGANQTIYEQAKTNSPGYDMYADGRRRGIFIQMNGSELQGKVWPGLTVFPDFTNVDNTTAFWKYWITYFLKNESVEADGLWIDMNEPSNFVPGSVQGCQRNRWNNPPYVIPILEGEKDNGSLYYQTICMDARQSWGRHYDVHNLYGHSESMVTYRALREITPTKRPFVLSRSTFSGTSRYASKWLGDNRSQWSDMHWSIVGLLEFSIFGYPMIGADICGFNGDAQYEMCIRWHQLGAFYPFSRNHNGIHQKAQDPGAWDQAFLANVRRHLRLRYELLPYMYTLFKEAHTSGTTVVRPLMFEFSTDTHTWDIDQQFLLGGSLLISPVLQANVTSLHAYFPKGRWFDYYTGREIAGHGTGRSVSIEAPLSTLSLHLRGGGIVPVQEPGNTTATSRLNPMGLLVALNESWDAFGTLFIDDGESEDSIRNHRYLDIQFRFTLGEVLDITVVHGNFVPSGNLTFNTIDIYGLNRHPKRVRIDDKVTLSSPDISSHFSIIQLSNLNLDVTKNHTIKFEMETK